MIEPPRDLEEGEELSASWFRKLLAFIRRNRIIIGPGCGLRAVYTEAGIHLSVGAERDKFARVGASNIAALSGSTYSKGSCFLYVLDDALTEVIGEEIQAVNPSTTIMTAGSRIFVGIIDGKWTIKNKLDC